MLSYKDLLEYWNFSWSKFEYNTFQIAKNQGTEQTVQMQPSQVFFCQGPYDNSFIQGNLKRVKSKTQHVVASVISIEKYFLQLFHIENLKQIKTKKKTTCCRA